MRHWLNNLLTTAVPLKIKHLLNLSIMKRKILYAMWGARRKKHLYYFTFSHKMSAKQIVRSLPLEENNNNNQPTLFYSCPFNAIPPDHFTTGALSNSASFPLYIFYEMHQRVLRYKFLQYKSICILIEVTIANVTKSLPMTFMGLSACVLCRFSLGESPSSWRSSCALLFRLTTLS